MVSSLGGGGRCLDPKSPSCSREARWGARLGAPPCCSLLLLQSLGWGGELEGPVSPAASLAPKVPCVNHYVFTPTAPFNGGHCLKLRHHRLTTHFVDDEAMVSVCRAGPRTQAGSSGFCTLSKSRKRVRTAQACSFASSPRMSSFFPMVSHLKHCFDIKTYKDIIWGRK